ncbi:MAG: cupin domain-containing protein [Myxococcaceae bacterium]
MHNATATLAVAAFLLATSAGSQAPVKPSSTEDAQVVHLQDVKWAAPKLKEFPPGALAAVIAVDPQTGGSLGYGKFPAGYKLPTHWHSFTEYTVLLSGNATFTVDGKAIALSAGDYIVIPAKVHHSLTCDGSAPCVLLTRRAGPTDYHFEG